VSGYTIVAGDRPVGDAATLVAAAGHAKELARQNPGTTYQVQRNDGRVLEATYQVVKGAMRAVIR